MFNKDTIRAWQQHLAEGHSETWLKTAIVLVAVVLVLLALTINNKWILAAILLYEVLP